MAGQKGGLGQSVTLKEAGISQRCCSKRGASQERSRLLALVPRNSCNLLSHTVRPSCRSGLPHRDLRTVRPRPGVWPQVACMGHGDEIQE